MYGLVLQVVRHRTRDIAIRLALGATLRVVRWDVASTTLWMALPGLVIGSAVAASVLRVAEASIFTLVLPTAWGYVLAALSVGVIAVSAGYAPTAHAGAIDPARLLQRE